MKVDHYPKSLDYLERERYLKPSCSPFGNPVSVTLSEGEAVSVIPEKRISLDGTWEMVLTGDGLKADFSSAVPAEVPGSVHCALIAAGKLVDDEGNPIDDPY